MTFSQFLAILRARKWAAIIVFAISVVTAVVLSLVLPAQYTGTASVVVDVKPDPISAMVMPTIASPTFMATQVDILQSDRVALRVIKDLKLNENAAIRQQWQEEAGGKGSLEQWLIDQLQRKLDVKPSRESNVITINYGATDPRFAAGLANAFAQAYISTTLELRADPAQRYTRFFDEQVKAARDSLEKAQNRLSAYQQAKGIIASDERLDVETARLNDLSAQFTQLQALAAESDSRRVQAQGTQADQTQEVLNNSLVASLKADVVRGQAKLQELTQRLGDNNPQVIEAKANLAELRSRLDNEVKRVTSSVGINDKVTKQRMGDIQRSLQAQREKVLRMKAVRDDGVVLQRDVENAQRVLDSLVARLSQSGLEAQSTQGYANMLTVAQPPAEASSPKLLLNTALAVVLGGLLAIAVAVLVELSDRRVRAADDVVQALGIPVLGTLPTPTAKRFRSGHRAVQYSPANSLSLPAPGAAKGI